MEVIDGNWILRRLSGRHGEKRELADYVGIEPEKLAKILSGYRKVQAEEVPRFISYFDGNRPGHDSLSDRESRLIELLRQLTEQEMAAIEATASAFASRDRKEGK